MSQAIDWQALTGEFYCVDVGSRGGFHDLRLLRPWIHMYSIDADAAAESRPQGFASFRHLPVALYSSEGKTELTVTEQPGLSSFLEFDAGTFVRHFGLMRGSETWKRGFAQVSRQKVYARTADDVFRSLDLARVDFLKLDTQGTELEILKGMREYLDAGRIHVLKTEVSFIAVYRNQCVFSDVDQFLRQHGFVFVDCTFYPDSVYPASAMKAVQGVKLEERVRATAVGDAVYVLHPSRYTGADRAGFTIRSAVLLNQLGYTSLAFDLLRVSTYPADVAEKVLQETARRDHLSRWKQALQYHLPPWAYRKVLRLGRALLARK